MKPYHQEVANVSEGIISFFSKTFKNIYVEGPKLDPAKIQQNPFMAISTHRSHVDYFILGLELFKMGFQNLRFAAGDNLTNLPYIGPRFKSFGAFTVERDTGFERNYVRNLCSSVMNMMEAKDLIIVFPEGGRSYSGATLEIKNGVLGAAIMLQAKLPDQDVYFLPAAISYEHVPDLPFFKLLLKGKKMRKKSNFFLKRLMGNLFYFGGDILAFTPFLTAHKLNRNYGNVYIDYSEPVSVRSIIDVQSNRLENTRDEFSAHRLSMQQFSQYIHSQLKFLYRLMPIHVLASVLHESNPIPVADAKESISKLVEHLHTKQYNLKTLDSMNSNQIIEYGIDQLNKFTAISAAHGLLKVKKPEIISYFNASIEKKGA